jgi:hypothetical protein
MIRGYSAGLVVGAIAIALAAGVAGVLINAKEGRAPPAVR